MVEFADLEKTEIKTYARVLTDSVSPQGKRLTTYEYCAHRYILAEINTHQSLAKNARSSRAVPVKKLIEEVRTNPALPTKWLKNKPGMQGGDEMDVAEIIQAKIMWMTAANTAADAAEALAGCNLHKQWANRGLEPYLYVYGVISGTNWNNFFHLRDHEAAQPEFQLLAQKMREARDSSKPNLLIPGQWHLPYIDMSLTDLKSDYYAILNYIANNDTGMSMTEMSLSDIVLSIAKKVSAARVARVSYTPFDGDPSIKKEMERADGLIGNGHMSPFGHVATPDHVAYTDDDGVTPIYDNPKLHAYYDGWIPYRMQIPNEHVKG